MKKTSWYKPKPYTHITKKLSKGDAGLVKGYVSDAKTVERHAFYPLLHRTIVTKRYKEIAKDSKGKAIKGHKKKAENGKRISTAKYREIFYCNHLDAHIYSYYTHAILEPLYEAELRKDKDLNESVLAYRKIPLPDNRRCKCNIDFANEVFELIKGQTEPVAVIALDITKFFDSLDHKLLKQAWYRLLGETSLPKDHYNLYKSLTNFSYVEINDLLKEFGYKHPNQLIQKEVNSFITDAVEFRERIKYKGYLKANPFRNETKDQVGIPQGTPISAFLANLYLLAFDKIVLDLVRKYNGVYRRYSDDILIICPIESHEEIESEIYSQIRLSLLTIQKQKTQKTYFYNSRLINNSKPLTYLGFQFDGKRVLIKSTSLSKFYRKMKSFVKYKAGRAKRAKRKNRMGLKVDATLHRKQLYSQFSFLGASNDNKRKRNFISYSNFASEVINSPAIKKQLSNAWSILHKEIDWYERKYKLPKINQNAAFKLSGNYRILSKPIPPIV